MVATLEPDAHEKSFQDLTHEFHRDALRLAIARAEGTEFDDVPVGSFFEAKLEWDRIEGGRIYGGELKRISFDRTAGTAPTFDIEVRAKSGGTGRDIIFSATNAGTALDVLLAVPVPFVPEALGEDVLALLNDAVAQYEAHRVLIAASVHGAADNTNVITATAPATDEAEAVALANDLKAMYEAHRVLTAGSVHGAVDDINLIEAPDAGKWSSVITLVNEIKTDYEAHRVLTTGGVHGAADSTNVITAADAGNRGFVWVAIKPIGGAASDYKGRLCASPMR